jgi:hypothetical protein
LLANNFGDDAWPSYLSAIEQSDPRINALGITDYYSLKGYQEVVAHKKAGRLPDVGLIFPNVEMRFGIGTGHNHPANFHLLVSPEDPEHVEQTLRFMRRTRSATGSASPPPDRTSWPRGFGHAFSPAFRAGSLDPLGRVVAEESGAAENGFGAATLSIDHNCGLLISGPR